MRAGAVVTDQPIAFTVSTTKELLALLQSARVAIAVDASNAILSRGLSIKLSYPAPALFAPSFKKPASGAPISVTLTSPKPI
ncbi:MAG: hypothetical protein HC926_04125 [Synechococcaceae cyanobacterium SM2_3_60]|nr:hypothetical protein [Synechococcaceae cyanobacterium SM2_3_60]